MALVKCSECGTEVSDKANSCPKCGCPIVSYTECPECKAKISDKLKICSECGCPISAVSSDKTIKNVALTNNSIKAPKQQKSNSGGYYVVGMLLLTALVIRYPWFGVVCCVVSIAFVIYSQNLKNKNKSATIKLENIIAIPILLLVFTIIGFAVGRDEARSAKSNYESGIEAMDKKDLESAQSLLEKAKSSAWATDVKTQNAIEGALTEVRNKKEQQEAREAKQKEREQAREVKQKKQKEAGREEIYKLIDKWLHSTFGYPKTAYHPTNPSLPPVVFDCSWHMISFDWLNNNKTKAKVSFRMVETRNEQYSSESEITLVCEENDGNWSVVESSF